MRQEGLEIVFQNNIFPLEVGRVCVCCADICWPLRRIKRRFCCPHRRIRPELELSAGSGAEDHSAWVILSEPPSLTSSWEIHWLGWWFVGLHHPCWSTAAFAARPMEVCTPENGQKQQQQEPPWHP